MATQSPAGGPCPLLLENLPVHATENLLSDGELWARQLLADLRDARWRPRAWQAFIERSLSRARNTVERQKLASQATRRVLARIVGNAAAAAALQLRGSRASDAGVDRLGIRVRDDALVAHRDGRGPKWAATREARCSRCAHLRAAARRIADVPERR